MLRSPLVALAFLSASHAAAADRVEVLTARIFHGDLDLATDAGARTMLRRIALRSRDLCADVESPLLPRAQAYAWRCRRKAVEQALQDLGSLRVSQTYAAMVARGGLAELLR
jgi:UrcA family protein